MDGMLGLKLIHVSIAGHRLFDDILIRKEIISKFDLTFIP